MKSIVDIYHGTFTSDNTISVLNNGSFVSQIYVTYSLPDTLNSITTVNFSNGETKLITIPKDATNIDVVVNIVYTDTSLVTIYEDFFSNSTTLKLELLGTLSSPIVKDITNNLPNVGDPSPSTPPTIDLSKIPNKPIVMPGEEIVFTLNISHKGGDIAEYIKLTDTIPNEATFIPNSLTLNGIQTTDSSFHISSIDLGDMSLGDSHEITYKLIFNSIPNPNIVKNDPIVTYDYTDTDGSLKENSLSGATMPLVIGIVENNCCCPFICNCSDQDNSYVDYFNYI